MQSLLLWDNWCHGQKFKNPFSHNVYASLIAHKVQEDSNYIVEDKTPPKKNFILCFSILHRASHFTYIICNYLKSRKVNGIQQKVKVLLFDSQNWTYIFISKNKLETFRDLAISIVIYGDWRAQNLCISKFTLKFQS